MLLIGTGSLNVGAAEFRPSGSLSAVINAPEFVPGATWRSGSLGSGNGVPDAARSSTHSALSVHISCCSTLLQRPSCQIKLQQTFQVSSMHCTAAVSAHTVLPGTGNRL